MQIKPSRLAYLDAVKVTQDIEHELALADGRRESDEVLAALQKKKDDAWAIRRNAYNAWLYACSENLEVEDCDQI